ncbi:hypothetical protein [Natrialba swarupiae]|uniref:Uncharacterized protein n=1 Tax=Natrialba swarupiae TaxID=2448032 RepID=A0A5D5AR28_9EURY|nr:hypothetical protein [Natrialba swarupiae]MCW8173210.1 hypothetical protein [Natrialba swarupiae]TYT64036.1 hypothetical protein FYC77_01540 [Natrialba swarupiae]
MRSLLESDVGFYYAIGAFTLAVFVAGVVGLWAIGSSGVGTRELIGLVVGFAAFMLVYVVSIAVRRLEKAEDV